MVQAEFLATCDEAMLKRLIEAVGCIDAGKAKWKSQTRLRALLNEKVPLWQCVSWIERPSDGLIDVCLKQNPQCLEFLQTDDERVLSKAVAEARPTEVYKVLEKWTGRTPISLYSRRAEKTGRRQIRNAPLSEEAGVEIVKKDPALVVQVPRTERVLLAAVEVNPDATVMQTLYLAEKILTDEEGLTEKVVEAMLAKIRRAAMKDVRRGKV